MFRHVPNLLTASRLLLAVVFFALLSRYQYELGNAALLYTAFGVYLVALFTDWLDGYLARRWQVSSTFGRMTDPFVDKVLVLGSFIFFAGKNFVIPHLDPDAVPNNVKTITGVAPWMVVVLLARELLVTTFRGVSEAAGKNFGAQFSGKLKMTLQSITVLVILLFVIFSSWLTRHPDVASVWDMPARIARDIFIWGAIVVTVYSGLIYIRRAAAMFSEAPSDSTASPAGQNGRSQQ